MLLVPFYFCIVVGLSASQNTWLERSLSWRPLEFLGEISYGLYILQQPAAWLFFALLGRPGALDANGKSIELHHLIQTQRGPLAEVTSDFHGDYIASCTSIRRRLRRESIAARSTHFGRGTGGNGPAISRRPIDLSSMAGADLR